jgi:UPF0042 nucleotide-binding protein
MKMLLVTGLSGAGKTTVLNIMEDAGFETVDSLPISLIPLLLSSESASDRMIVVGADVRSRGFSSQQMEQILSQLHASGEYEVKTLFLDCDDEVLQRRYTETRRRHPLALDRTVMAGIKQERELLAPIRQQADEVINTSDYLKAELRQIIWDRFISDSAYLNLAVQSFSFKHGLPREADLVFDVRFLQNPYYLPELRELNGLDAPIQRYIDEDPMLPQFFEQWTAMLDPLLPRYLAEGKSYLTIAIGCTGGQHRSVYMASRLSEHLQKQGYVVTCRHRELERKKAAAKAVKG